MSESIFHIIIQQSITDFFLETRKSLFRILYDNIKEGNITEIYSTSYFNDNEKLTFEDLGEEVDF